MEKLIFFIILFCGFIFGQSSEFIVEFMGFDAAKVQITEIDTIYKGYEAKSITFKTETVSASKTLFPVDNTYHTIIKNDFSRILYFKKSTSQPWLKNELETVLINEKVRYKDSEIDISHGFLNIFTLLQYLNHAPIEVLVEKVYYLDREGQRFRASFDEINPNELFLNLENLNINSPIIKETDIFTWAVFREGAKRTLRIKNGKLVYCQFSIGFINMKAEIVEK